MKLKPKYLPLIGLITGLLAFGARIWLFKTGIDGRGLLRTAHPGNLLTYVLMALALGLLFLGTRKLPAKGSYRRMFRPSLLAAVGSCLAAAGIVYTTFSEPAGTGLLQNLSWVLGIAAGISLAIGGIHRMKGNRPAPLFSILVTLYMMVHILSQYRGWNYEPQLQEYLPQLLASAFLMLCAYQRAALDSNEGNPRRFLFFNYSALFFSCLSVYSSTPVFYLSMAIWTGTAHCDPLKPLPMKLPAPVMECIRTLEEAGHSAYAVGGCVRDWLLDRTPHDYDLCTSAKPEEICHLFEQYDLVRNGEKHGTIGVVINGNVYEITTYRTEGDYTDGRHPDWVEFVDQIQEDLARRDFTVNAMAYSPTRGYADPFGGQQDLEAGILRAVGEPEARFREDALRILRGVRFAARFSLEPEEKTLQAMFDCKELMEQLAKERILAELTAMLPVITAADLLRYTPIITQVIPELEACVAFDQKNPHHIHDVYTHTAHAVEAAPQDVGLRFAALLHDIGKPGCFTQDEDGVGHFYGHAAVGAQMANQIMSRLKASTALRQQVTFLIEHHMSPLEADRKLLRRRVGKYGLENVRQLLALQRADRIGTGTNLDALTDFDQMAELLDQLGQEESCLQLKDLAISGSDIIALGVEPGPQVGKCLEALFAQVLDETLPNDREALLAAAQEIIKEQ